MKRFYCIALAGTLCGLTGCATNSKLAAFPPVGPGPGGQPQASGQGRVQVFSARPLADTDVNMREFFWDDYLTSNNFPNTPAHSDYTIYGRDGRFVERVRNATNPNDPTPTVVSLPAGAYEVLAQAKGFSPQPYTVRIPIVIEPGQTTVVHLEGGWRPRIAFDENRVARLPNHSIVGWRATQ